MSDGARPEFTSQSVNSCGETRSSSGPATIAYRPFLACSTSIFRNFVSYSLASPKASSTDSRDASPPQSDVELMTKKEVLDFKPVPRHRQVGDLRSNQWTITSIVLDDVLILSYRANPAQ